MISLADDIQFHGAVKSCILHGFESEPEIHELWFLLQGIHGPDCMILLVNVGHFNHSCSARQH